MNSIQFLISTAISVYSFILILRVWFQVAKVDFYNPLSQTLVKATQPAISPLSKFAPTIKGIGVFYFRHGEIPSVKFVWHRSRRVLV